MKTFRPLRVGNLIRDELSGLILREVELPGAIVTITEVEVDKRMDWATVRVSVIPAPKAAMVLAILAERVLDLQYLLLRKINIKPMPHLRFELDEGPAKAAEIEKLLLKDNT
ncbi:MAG: ribosome-binding factor A [Patescibacteria group bacterium]